MAVVTSIVIGVGLVAGAGAAIYGANKAAKASREANAIARENMQTQAQIAAEQLRFQKEQQKKLDKQKAIYANFKFKNPYANMENVYEDLTVNTQQAQFAAAQDAQQRADILSQLSGAAGASGVASLAQALANQGAMQAQRASISIGQQERANQMASAKAASAVDMAERGGEATLQQQEMQRQSTLLGIEMGEMAGARSGVQQAYANQMAAAAGMVQAKSAEAQGYYGIAQAGIGLMGSSAQAGATMGAAQLKYG